MSDWLHVNPIGNMVLGFDVSRVFGGALPASLSEFCKAGLKVQSLLDDLDEKHLEQDKFEIKP